MNKKVEVKNLSKSFGSLSVLNDVNFSVKKGEFLGIVGPTGCGKTTFLNLLTRLIEPSSGEILIDGVPADTKKHNISFAFQEPSAMPWQTVEQNIRFGLELKKLPRKEVDKRVSDVLKQIGMEEFKNYYPRQLSASAEQRVIIGRAFAMQPDLLLMDEPYGQMDIKMRYYLEDEVIKMWQRYKTTVIFITHNIEEAVYLSERVLILSNKPATVKEEVKIDLPRPRNFASPEFVEIRKHITEQIKWW